MHKRRGPSTSTHASTRALLIMTKSQCIMQSRTALYRDIQGWSGRERWDVLPPLNSILREAQTSSYTHTYSMCLVYSKSTQHKRAMLHEHLHVCIIDHRQLLYVLLHTHRQYAQSYHNIINYTIIS